MIPPAVPVDEKERIAELHSLGVLDTPAEARFDRITRTATRIFDVPIALISLVDSSRQWFKSCQGIEERETPRDISFCGHAILEDSVMNVPDAKLDQRFVDNPLVTSTPGIRFYAGAPLFGPGGKKIGTMCIADYKPRTLHQEDLTQLADLSAWASLELAAAVLLRQEIKKKSEELHESELTFFRFMEKLPVGVFVLNAEGKPYYANQTAVQLLGRGIAPSTETDQLAEVYQIYVEGTDEEYPTDELPIVRALSGMSTEVQDMEIRRPDGILSIQVWATPIINKWGNITHAIAAFQDITPRKNAERRLAMHSAVASILSEARDIDQARTEILKSICESIGWDVGVFYDYNAGQGVLQCVDVWHSSQVDIPEFEMLTRKILFPSGLGLPGRVLSENEPTWIANIVEDRNFPRTPAAIKNGLHAGFAFPIRHEGHIIAAMEFFSRHIHQPDRQLLKTFDALGYQLGQFIAQHPKH
jgi:PAS domain S-box-containing protein